MSVAIKRSETVALTGPSGSGETTLLNLVAGLAAPTGGGVGTLGQELGELSRRQIAAFQAVSLGFVFQPLHLLPGLTRHPCDAATA